MVHPRTCSYGGQSSATIYTGLHGMNVLLVFAQVTTSRVPWWECCDCLAEKAEEVCLCERVDTIVSVIEEAESLKYHGYPGGKTGATSVSMKSDGGYPKKLSAALLGATGPNMASPMRSQRTAWSVTDQYRRR
ncbi:hypothetical protein AcV5_003676 [Taiwanofungus camphoratus]|nr:hypothetical protein AcV5_003676 [Antrodia cinnamomea]